MSLNEQNQLVPSLFDTIFENGLDLTSELLEIPLDQILENEFIKQFPIVGSIVKLGNMSIALRDRYLLKKTIAFVSSLNCNKISQDELKKHKKKLLDNKKQMEKELENVLITLDRFNEVKKSVIYANFYLAFIDEDIEFDWKDFCIFSEILERFSIYDYDTLRKIETEGYHTKDAKVNTLSLSRLNSLGLVDFYSGITVRYNDAELIAKITELGKLFFELGFKDKNNNYIEI